MKDDALLQHLRDTAQHMEMLIQEDRQSLHKYALTEGMECLNTTLRSLETSTVQLQAVKRLIKEAERACY